MPTLNIRTVNMRRTKNNVSFIAIGDNGQAIERTVSLDTVDNVEELSIWILAQEPNFTVMPDKDLAITFHLEPLVDPETGEVLKDPETGEDLTIRVFDSVVAS